MELRGVTGTAEDGVPTATQQKARDRKQKTVARKVLSYWKQNCPTQPYPAIVLPTGFGKSRIVYKILTDRLTKTGAGRVLAIVGTKEILVDQNLEALGALVEEDLGTRSFTVLPDKTGEVVLTIWQGLAAYLRRQQSDPEFDLVIVDELHNIGTEDRIKILQRLGAGRVVGLTATAFRSTGKFRAPDEYGFTVVESMGLPDCINKGWLSPMMALAIDTEVILPADVRAGEGLIAKELYRALRKHPDLFKNIGRDVARRFLPDGMKTVIVVNRINEEACVIARELQSLGFKVGLAVNKKASRELAREFITNDAIRRYKLPNDHPEAIQVLISPQVIGEGFDSPATELIVWAAPTLSALRYTQVMGRGARLCPYKRYCLVVDYVYLIENYGYSANFAQFFRKEELQELEGGYVYVGSLKKERPIELPNRYTAQAKVVPLVDLRTRLYPEAGDWLNAWEMATELKKAFNWIRPRLVPYHSRAERRRSQKKGKIVLYYPPEVLDELRKLVQHEGFYTERQLRTVLGRSANWLRSRLGRFKDQIIMLEAQNGRMAPHYPESVVSELRKEFHDAKEVKVELITLVELARRLETHKERVKKHLVQYHPNAGVKQPGQNNKISDHYPVMLVEILRSEMPPKRKWERRNP